MRLAFVEIAGFRGFRDKARFDLPGGFAVLSGRNGTGKSTMLDAVDFALTGNINKFSVKGARGHGLEEHIWWAGKEPAKEHYVKVGFVGDDGIPLAVSRSRESGCDTNSQEILRRLCNVSGQSSVDTLMQTTLIRDEFIAGLSLDLTGPARFEVVRTAIGSLLGPDHSKRTAEILKAASSGVTRQQDRVREIEIEIGRTLTDLTEARSAAERSSGIAEALKVLESLAVNIPAGLANATEFVRGLIADKRVVLRELERTRLVSEELVPELVSLDSPAALESLEASKASRDEAVRAKISAEEVLAVAIRLDADVKATDEFTAHLAAILEHGDLVGLQKGHCPLCNAARTEEQFQTALVSLKERLAVRGKMLADASNSLSKAQTAVAQADRSLATAESRLAVIEGRRAALQEKLKRVELDYARYGFLAQANDPRSAQLLLFAEQSNLVRMERALSVLESSTAIDRVKELEVRLASLRERGEIESGRLSAARRAQEAAAQIDAAARTVANQILAEQFDTVVPVLKELYRRLRPHVDWAEIDPDFGGKIRASLNFIVGDGLNPQFLFSSGQRRAAGLAFLFAVHLSRPWCRWRSLLLDDPVQHIDDYRALNLVEVLAAIRRTGRQVVVAVEDAALAELLCRRLRSGTDEGGKHFELRTSKTGTAEIAASRDIYPMPRLVLRPARAS